MVIRDPIMEEQFRGYDQHFISELKMEHLPPLFNELVTKHGIEALSQFIELYKETIDVDGEIIEEYSALLKAYYQDVSAGKYYENSFFDLVEFWSMNAEMSSIISTQLRRNVFSYLKQLDQ